MDRVVGYIVAVQKKQPYLANPHLPTLYIYRAHREFNPYPQPFPVWLPKRNNGQLSRIIMGVNFVLFPIPVNGLPEISPLVQYSHTDYRNAKVIGSFELIPGNISQTSGIDGKG